MTSAQPLDSYILTMSCPDRTGIVAAIMTFLAERKGLITEAVHFVDEYSDRSFMRTAFRGSEPAVAQNTPAPDDKGQKPAAEAAAPAPAEPPAAILPLVQFEDAPLVDVIKTLARQAGVNVIFDPRVTQVDQTGKSTYSPVSIRLENVTAQNVLEAVLQNNSLRLDKDAKTKISRVTIKDPAAAEPLVVKVYQLKYAYPTNVVPTVKPTISTRGQVIPDVRTSQLIILATEKEVALARVREIFILYQAAVVSAVLPVVISVVEL